MKFNNFDKRIGREICSFVLVGTMIGCVFYGRVVGTKDINDDKKTYISDIDLGFYTDEDVKANREKLMNSIEISGGEESKKYGKKNKIVVPKKITR